MYTKNIFNWAKYTDKNNKNLGAFFSVTVQNSRLWSNAENTNKKPKIVSKEQHLFMLLS